jgi:hypothetical protein
MRQKIVRSVPRQLDAFSTESDILNPHFLQDAESRPRVMLRHPGVERSGLFQAEESVERLGGHAAAPKGAVDPIADLSLPSAGQLQMFPTT